MKTVYIVSNSHIDPVWLWNKYEGIDEVINTFRSACDRLDENPDLHFSASSITFYKWVLEYAPDLFERIKKHVASGQWEIVGAWLVEGDCNLPLSESFYKSAEISRKFMKEHFGVDTDVAYSPDTFGHPAALPEALVDTGFKYYVFCRPSEHENSSLPSNLFYWEHNNKKILCYRLKYHYMLGWNMSIEDTESKIDDESMYVNDVACLFIGMGDHGGGPTKKEIQVIKELQKKRTDINIVFATCEEFFAAAEKIPNIPTVTGDLHYHAIGCYSVNRKLKEAIRNNERALGYTQRIFDNNNTDVNLDDLWESTIFNEFHDIMPGSCDPDAADQAMRELASVQNTLDIMTYGETKKLSRKLPVICSQGEFRIYNSLPFDVTGPFEIESFMYYREGALFKKYDGTVIPIQEITPSVYCSNRRWMFTDTIPAKSMASYYFDSEDDSRFGQDKRFSFEEGSKIAGFGKEVSNLNASIEKPLFKSSIELEVLNDESDTWSHGIPAYDYGTAGKFETKSVTTKEGEIASFLNTKMEFGNSRAEMIFKIYKGMPFIDLDINIRWNEDFKVLKLNLEPNAEFNEVLIQGAGGAIPKKTNFKEEPLHGWLVCGDLGICQTGAFAYDRKDGKICITLVRSCLYGWDISCEPDKNGHLNYTDVGEHKFKMRLFQGSDLSLETMNKNLASFIEPFSVIRENK